MIDKLIEKLVHYGDVLLRVVIIIVVGLLIDYYLSKLLKKALKNERTDSTLLSFLRSLCKIFIRFMIVISVLGSFGVNTTSLATVLASLGAALALGVKNTLGNFTSGIIILFLKPFKVGDYIEIGTIAGTVKEIQVMSTILNTAENKRVIIPNGNLTIANIINYTAEDHRRIDYTIVVEHREEVEKVKKVILEVLSEGELVLKEPTPSIDIISYETNKVVLQLKFWIVGNDISDILAVFLKELFDKTTKENLLFSIQRKS